MIKIDIYINYYGDGTSSVREIYINNIRKANFDPEKGKIDFSVLKDYEGYFATVVCTYIDDIAKNHNKRVKIVKVELTDDGNYVLHYDVL